MGALVKANVVKANNKLLYYVKNGDVYAAKRKVGGTKGAKRKHKANKK